MRFLSAYTIGIKTTKETKLQTEINVTSIIFRLSFKASKIIRYERLNSEVMRPEVIRTTVSSKIEITRKTMSATSG